jgi:hypothetical protein
VERLDDLILPGILVTTTSDLAGHSGTSLRDAMATANATAAAGKSATITFDPSLAGATITLAQGQLELSGAGGGKITIDGSGLSSPITIDGSNATRVFQVDQGAQALLTGLTIQGGNAPSPGVGGGISNAGTLNVSNDTISNNRGGNQGAGGGIYNSGSLTVTNSTIASNSAGIAGIGGGISNSGTALVKDCTISANTAGDGGGIGNSGILMVSGCTFTSNSAEDPFDSGGGGGGVFTNASSNSLGALVLNSTFYGNSAGSGTAGNYGDGGAINGGAAVINCTIVGNSASAPTAFDYFGGGSGGGIYYAGLVLNTIVAGNTATGGGPAINVPPTNVQQQVFGTVGTSNLVGGNPLVGTLGSYGGPTQTIPLLPGSPASGAAGAVTFLTVGVNATAPSITIPSTTLSITASTIPTPIWIDNEQMLMTRISGSNLTVVRGYNGTTAAGHNINASIYFATDQRGVPRPPGGIQDIGAFEGTVGPPPRILPTLANALTHSAEYYAGFITAAYQKYLGRTPLPSEVAAWVNAMLNGLSDERLEAGFIGSPEYITNHGGSGAAWVTGMYQDLLGRTPAASEVTAWVQALEGRLTPNQVAYGFAASAEREGQRVTADYQKFLGRAPAPAEGGGWVTAFENGYANEDVIAGFVGSPEYYQAHGSDASSWVSSAFQGILSRQPSSAELQAWVGLLMNG